MKKMEKSRIRAGEFGEIAESRNARSRFFLEFVEPPVSGCRLPLITDDNTNTNINHILQSRVTGLLLSGHTLLGLTPYAGLL